MQWWKEVWGKNRLHVVERTLFIQLKWFLYIFWVKSKLSIDHSIEWLLNSKTIWVKRIKLQKCIQSFNNSFLSLFHYPWIWALDTTSKGRFFGFTEWVFILYNSGSISSWLYLAWSWWSHFNHLITVSKFVNPVG